MSLRGIVGALAVGRDDGEKLFGPAVGRVAGLDSWSDVVGGVRQVRDERLDLLEGVLFGLGLVVDLAALVDVHLVSAELLLVEHLTDGALHHRRA